MQFRVEAPSVRMAVISKENNICSKVRINDNNLNNPRDNEMKEKATRW